MNVLCVIAHPDDEVLGAGATLRKLHEQGHTVYTCILCAPADARHGRPSGSMTLDFRNIKVNRVTVEYRPAWIVTHNPGDLNIDHRICYQTMVAAAMLPHRLSTDLPADAHRCAPPSLERGRHLSHLRGEQVGIELAEAFVLARDVNP